jgi:hypothetical protein
MPKSDLDPLPFVLFLALGRNKGGGGGAPAELGIPQPPIRKAIPTAAKPSGLATAHA